jgi:hypothetical protein
LLDTAMINSYIYYKSIPINGYSKTTHHNFRLDLVRSLLERYNPIQTNTIQNASSQSNTSYHLPEYQSNPKICHFCKETSQGTTLYKKSHMLCIECNVHLCLNKDRNCFKEHHLENVPSFKRKRVRSK